MKVIFVDKFCLSSLFRMLRTFRSCEFIYHFEHASRTSEVLLNLMLRLGFMRCRLETIDNHVGQIKDEEGESQYIRLLVDARSIVSGVAKAEVRENPLIELMDALWASDKVGWYCEKDIEQEIRTECLRIGLVLWLLRTQIAKPPGDALLLIERNPWLPYLEEYARLHGIRLVGYRRCRDQCADLRDHPGMDPDRPTQETSRQTRDMPLVQTDTAGWLPATISNFRRLRDRDPTYKTDGFEILRCQLEQ